MVKRGSEHTVTRKVPGGNSARFRVVEDPAGGRVFLWLEPAMNPDDIVPFYRITRQGEEPVESWKSFQDGDAIAPYAGEKGASLGAIELLDAGQYQIDASIFTGLKTIYIPAIDIELQAITEDPLTAEARAVFNASFTELFRKFFELRVTDQDTREYFDGFIEEQVDFLMAAIVSLGAPDDYLNDEETNDLGGFFDLIDYLTALAHSCGDSALTALSQHPDSPTNRHYIGFIKQCLGDERLLTEVLKKYPYCA